MRQLFPSYVRVPLVFFTIFGIIEFFIDSGNEPAFLKYPIIMLFLALVFLIIIAIEAIVSALENVMYQSLDEAAKERYIAAKNRPLKFTWLNNAYKKLVGTKPMEKEQELILVVIWFLCINYFWSYLFS